jgi:hypothetical protein
VPQRKSKSIRRSIALSADLLREVQAHAEPELRTNVNQLVTVALKEFLATRKRRRFEQAMAAMSCDPQILKESQRISKAFEVAELDGLND